MVKQNKKELEQIFTRLSECGYSKKATETIQRWYHATERAKPKKSKTP